MIHIRTKIQRPSQELVDRFSKVGAATVHEASGRKGAVDSAIKPIRKGLRLCGPAFTVQCAPGDGVIKKPAHYAHDFPDLLSFHDAPTPIEHKLFVMHLKHRMRTFQGTFHANPDYALWYGWSEMLRDLAEIKQEAEELRHKQADKVAKKK